MLILVDMHRIRPRVGADSAVEGQGTKGGRPREEGLIFVNIRKITLQPNRSTSGMIESYYTASSSTFWI
jgi:hypothetical protein